MYFPARRSIKLATMGNHEIRQQIERVTGTGRSTNRLRRYLRGLLFLIGLAVLVITLVHEQGVIGTWKLSRAEQQLRAENEKLRLEKNRLQDEVHKLRTSRDIIEKRAREMGLVYPGEVVIDTRGDNAATLPPRADTQRGPGRP